MQELGIRQEEKKVFFGQLLGMADQISFTLGTVKLMVDINMFLFSDSLCSEIFFYLNIHSDKTEQQGHHVLLMDIYVENSEYRPKETNSVAWGGNILECLCLECCYDVG